MTSPRLQELALTTCDVIIVYVTSYRVVDGKTLCLQGQVYLAWVRPRDLTTGKFERSQSQVGAVFSLGRFSVAGPRRYPALPRRYHTDRDAI